MLWDNSTGLSRGFVFLKSRLVSGPPSAPLVGSQRGTQPLQSYSQWAEPLQWVTTGWITMGSDSSIAGTLQAFRKHLSLPTAL